MGGVAAVVVLGCRIDAAAASPRLARRVACGSALVIAGTAPLLVLSGGGPGPLPEAEAMRQVALAHGVADAAIILEPRSRNTYENAVETARLLAGRGPAPPIVLVTDRYHVPRATFLFRHAGMIVAGAVHPPTGGFMRELPGWLHEMGALAPTLARILLYRRPQ